MKQIDITQIPRYAPTSDAAKRLYNWMQASEALNPGLYFLRDDLLERGRIAGFSRNTIWDALSELEKVVDCGSFWNGKTMAYRICPMTPEEKITLIQDVVWFEGLD